MKVNPQSSALRSLDVFLLICLLFVFGALLELAITGMADPKGAKWWRTGKSKDEDNQQEDDKRNKKKKLRADFKDKFSTCRFSACVPLLRRSILGRCGPNDVTTDQPISMRSSAPPTAVREDEEVGLISSKEKKSLRFFGPFVFFQTEPHIVDQYAKIIFPSLYGTFLLFFFMFHYFHKDTVGGSNSP